MITPEADAVKFVYDVLDAAMAVGPPAGELRALGVTDLYMDEPGRPGHNVVGVLFGGGRELDDSGLTKVDVLVDIYSQELMMGATTNKLARFKERIQLMRRLLRQANESSNREMMIGPMEYPVEATEPDKDNTFFYNATITVPITVGGGI